MIVIDTMFVNVVFMTVILKNTSKGVFFRILGFYLAMEATPDMVSMDYID